MGVGMVALWLVVGLAGAAEPTVVQPDPAGRAPARSIRVVTEDGRDARLVIRPGDAWRGSPRAKVAVVEFTDLECPFCPGASEKLRRLAEVYGDEVLFVTKPFPLDPACNPGVKNAKHPHACAAHRAALCAQDQGRFRAFHDVALKNQHDLSDATLRLVAGQVGLDLAAFDACVQAPTTAARLSAAAADGAAVDTHGVPRIWIGDQRLPASSTPLELAEAIEVALGRHGEPAPEKVAALRDDVPATTPLPADVPSTRHVTEGPLSFDIDTFEAAVVDGKATSGLHRVPTVRVTWAEAGDACAAAGARLCTEQEWLAACQGALPVDDDGDGAFTDDLIEGTVYPYGDVHAAGACWEGHTWQVEGTAPWRPVYTGELPGCVSRHGVVDLAGNVEEWVGATPEAAATMGGAFDTEAGKARCGRRNDTYGPGYRAERVGFRCCR